MEKGDIPGDAVQVSGIWVTECNVGVELEVRSRVMIEVE